MGGGGGGGGGGNRTIGEGKGKGEGGVGGRERGKNSTMIWAVGQGKENKIKREGSGLSK